MNAEEVQTRLRAHGEEFETKNRLLANEVYQNYVVPLCKEHNLRLVCRFGDSYFTRTDATGLVTYDDPYDDGYPEDVTEVLRMLNAVAAMSVRLGDYMSEYDGT